MQNIQKMVEKTYVSEVAHVPKASMQNTSLIQSPKVSYRPTSKRLKLGFSFGL